MLRENNSIIVVDDSKTDLERIARVFNTHGIGCKTILYDVMSLPEKTLLYNATVLLEKVVIRMQNHGDYSLIKK